MDNTTSTLGVRSRTKFAMTPRWVARAGKALSPTAKALYTAIMSYADNDSYLAFPGQDRLGADLGVSVSTVHRAMKELEQFGALEVERRRNPRTGNFYGNRYTLVFDEPVTSEDSETCRSAPSVTSENGGLSPVTEEVDPFTPRPKSSSLPVASSADDATALKAAALAMYQDGCEDPDHFIDLYETIHPGASTDLGHLIINAWGPEGTTARIDRLIAKAAGKRDPVTYGVGTWVRTLRGITHGTLEG